MFLSNWLIFKIVLATVTGLVDYPVAADVLLVYDGVNKIYLSGGSLDYVDDYTLYTTIGGETTTHVIPAVKNIINGEETILTGSLTGTDRLFGMYSAFDGNYLYVGGRGDNGVKYSRVDVFEKNNGTWSYLTSITGDNTESSDNFGWKIGACENYLIVGAYTEDTGGGNTGAAYVFKRTGATWTQQEMLKAPSPASGTGYGDNDLAINGDYAFVGASGDGTGGEVFVYKRSGTSWNHHQTLVSSDISSSDDFGEGLDLSGNYLVVGAPGENSNYGALYIFKNIGGTWTQQQKLVSTVSGNMGRNARLSIDGDYIVTGGHQDGSDGLSNSGAVYIFKKDEGVEAWTQQATLRAPTPIANGYFGSKTRIKGKTVIVGQPNDGDNGTNAGAVYIYQRSGTTWSFIKKFYSSDIDTGDQFGTSVSISENDVFVSAMYEDSQGSNAGKGYIYPLKEVTNYYITQPGTYRADLQICGIDYKTNEVEVTGSVTPEKTWGNEQKLLGETASDYFGYSVSISGDYAIVGAPYEDTGGSNAGAAYIYTRNPSTGVWGSEQKILGEAAGDEFGKSVSISGDYAIVGAPYEDTGASSAGAAYIYTRSGTTWGNEQKILGETASDYFGYSVSISGDYAIVGSPGEDTGASSAGAAYIYTRSGTTWGNEQKILGETAGDNFGYSVSISGDYAIVGAPYEDTGASSAGATYIYTRSVTTWGNEQKILGETAGDYFGYSVSISGDYAIVGAPYEDTGASSAGAAYIYTRSGTTWGNEQKLLGEVASDFFGWSVAIDGGNAIVGAQYEDTGASNAGAAYIYELTPVAGLTFDGYNQLSLTNTPTYRSSKLAYGSNVYDVGTLTDKLFIEKTGEYTSLTFDTSSNVAYFSNISIQNVNVISDYIDEYGIADYSTYNGANNAGWTMDEWSLRPLRWNRDDRNNSLYVPVPASSSDPFAIDTLFHFYVQSLVANGFSSNGENFPFPTKNGVLWEVDMKNIELSCYNNNARVTGSSLESTYGIGGNTFFQLQCNKNNTNDVNIYIYYSRTSSTGKIFDFWWSISNKNNSVNNSETICLIQNVDLSNDTVLKYGWYKFDKTEGKPEFYISVGGQTVSEKVSFSLNNAYKDFHDETYGGCEVADPVSPDNSNYDSHMGWPFRHFMASGTRAAVGDNNTSEARTDLKRGLICDMMYFKYNNVFEKIPKIDFDGYNKLSIENITPTATTLQLGSNTYDIGTASNVYIEDTGTYQIETKDANTFALVSNVVTGTISPHPTDAVPSLTFDTYNKLSIENITPTATTLRLGSNTYEIGTASNVYIEDTGTYEIETKDANTFALVSNVVSGDIQPYTFMKNVQTIYGTSSSEQLGWSDNEGGGTICFNKDGTKLALSSYTAKKVYVYTLTNGTYVLDSGMPLTSSNHLFGYAVSLNDDGTILATNHFGGSNQQTGDTYVYQYSGGQWSLRATFGGGLYYTKASVLDGVGNRVLASAGGTNTMKIYDWNGTTYAETYSFSGSSEFAAGMDMTRDGLIVGGISKTTSDIVKVWQYSNGSWSQMGSDVSVGDMLPFFRLNRVGGTRFVTSNPDDDTAGTNYGILKVYDYANGSWTNTKTFYGDSTGTYLGWPIDISDDGTVIIAGGKLDDTKGTDAGMFYEFKEINGVWETKKFYDNVAGIQFGSGVAMNSTANVYAIGAGYDDTFENNAGKVVIYKSENVFSFDG